MKHDPTGKGAKIRKTVAIRRGISEIVNLAHADVEASDGDDPPRWTKRQRREIERAFAWLNQESLP